MSGQPATGMGTGGPATTAASAVSAAAPAAATQPPSLQGRLLRAMLAAGAAVWCVVALLTWRDVRHELDELLDSHLAQAAALLVVQQSRPPDDDDGPGLDAPTLHRYAPKVVFQVFHEGRLVLRSANAPVAPLWPTSDASPAGYADVVQDGARWRVFATHGAERDVQVYVAEAQASRQAILGAVMRSALGPLAAALPLLALAAWWAVRRGLAPLRALGRLLAGRAPQALQPVAMAPAPQEMQPLLAALNGLLARIAAMLDSERRFTADAAHELRTPIAAVRAQAQVALGAAGDAERRHALQATLDGCDRATRLVNQLLLLARLDASALAPGAAAGADQPPVLDLAPIAREVLAEQAGAAWQRGQTLSLRAEQPCLVRGDATLLAVLLRNLVDNACRYSPDAACVQLQLQPGAAGGSGWQGGGGGVRLVLDDSGPGLAAADRARLGERFFRAAGSTATGSGLGWSIVRRIAAAHGATLQVQPSALLGGLQVTVSFAPP